MLGCQNHDDAVWGEISEFAPDEILHVKPLGRRVQPDRPALMAVIEREIAASGKTDNKLLQIVMGMASANGVLFGAPYIVDALHIKIVVYSLFQGHEVASVIAMNCKIL